MGKILFLDEANYYLTIGNIAGARESLLVIGWQPWGQRSGWQTNHCLCLLLLWCYYGLLKKKTVKDSGISTRYPPEVLENFRELAVAHRRSLNGETDWALRAYIAREQAHANTQDEQQN